MGRKCGHNKYVWIWQHMYILSGVARLEFTVNRARSFTGLFVISLKTEGWLDPKSTLGTAIIWKACSTSVQARTDLPRRSSPSHLAWTVRLT